MWPFRSSKPRPGDEPSDEKGQQVKVWTGRERDMTLTRAYRAIVCELSEQKQAFDRAFLRFVEMERRIETLAGAVERLAAQSETQRAATQLAKANGSQQEIAP